MKQKYKNKKLAWIVFPLASNGVKKSLQGMLLVQVAIWSAIGAVFIAGFVGWANVNLQLTRQTAFREEAIGIAEAGIDYYRWHLAHAPQDYQDGTGGAGPYAHIFYDKDGNVLGNFTLTITAPILGSSLVTVQSKGTASSSEGTPRTIKVQLAKPSFAKYAVAANENMRFGSGTEVFGPIHSNNGIRFDGLAHNLITSAVGTYDDPDHSGANEFGVHTHLAPVDPLPPAAVPARTDVFIAGRQFPVPAVDFAGITADLSQIKTDAQASGFYRSASGSLGYHVVLQTDDTFKLYKITSLRSPPSGCSNGLSQSGWGTWSVNNQSLLGTYAIPANGLMFLEDNVWVDGQINTARLTIAAATFPDNPATRKSITVNTNLLYTNYDGQDVLALISQQNINVGLYSDNIFRIDAALIAQNGRAGRYYYSSSCGSNYVRNTLTLYGMIGTNQRYGFAYTNGTGYTTRDIIYDANLLYGPPPSFPLTSDQYQVISWEEVE